MKSHYLNKDSTLSLPLPLPLPVFICLLMLLGGCAGSKETATARAPLEPEHWEKIAETSQGHSPLPVKREITIPDYRKQIEQLSSESQEKPLPTKKISLKMHNADVKAILRALARAMDINLLVKDDVRGTTSVDFEAVPWDQVFRSLMKSYGLSYVWEGDILRVLTPEDMEQALKAATLKGQQEAAELSIKASEPLSTVVVPIDYAAANALRDNLQKFLPVDPVTKIPHGSILLDDHSNSLIIQASRSDIEKIISIIQKVDKPTPQILIRANIVETTKDVARDLGIQWGGFLRANHKLSVTPGGSANATSQTVVNGVSTLTYVPTSGATGISAQGFGFNFPVPQSAITSAGGVGSLGLLYGTPFGNILDAQLQALQSEGKANIISSPSLTTLDNQKAFTQSGQKVPYVSLQSSGGTTTSTVNFVDAVLRLEITPHVIDGKNLKMTILVKKDDVNTSQSVQGNPYIIQKQTETTLIAQDGETIVISGLTSQNKSNSINGVPGLKDIPGIGWLFRGQSQSDTTDEVLIFITPHILPPKTAEGNEEQNEEPEIRDQGPEAR